MAENEAASLTARRTISLREAAKQLGIAHVTVERHVASGKLPSIKVGARRLIPIDAFEQVLAGTWEPKQGPGRSDGPA